MSRSLRRRRSDLSALFSFIFLLFAFLCISYVCCLLFVLFFVFVRVVFFLFSFFLKKGDLLDFTLLDSRVSSQHTYSRAP